AIESARVTRVRGRAGLSAHARDARSRRAHHPLAAAHAVRRAARLVADGESGRAVGRAGTARLVGNGALRAGGARTAGAVVTDRSDAACAAVRSRALRVGAENELGAGASSLSFVAGVRRRA